MELPDKLLQAIDNQIAGKDHSALLSAAEALSLRYRTADKHGQKRITTYDEALSYCVSRMPATYGAVFSSLSNALSLADIRPRSLLDVGAGTGAAFWAASELLNLREVTCLEREDILLKLGEALTAGKGEDLSPIKWVKYDIQTDSFMYSADLVIASYVLNELAPEHQIKTAILLFDATNELVLFVEPGTPQGFSNLRKIRTALLDRGAYMLAPCPHDGLCPILSGDWCHFTCRIQRSSLHRRLKRGDAPFEDEKFSYLALAKKTLPLPEGRILRHPQIRKGFIMLEACTVNGVKRFTLSKKDGERYKQARKANAGDSIGCKALKEDL
ncbi:MAG: rRNA methyltransferase [Clostridiales bacterium]|jgi:ribosomal protein RSM22 (predicted rRNA methylase)|nr:rRNA methyltransferase [Clostridiales bacterium]